MALGGKVVLSSAMPVCSELLRDASNWRRRKAGLLTLLLIGEVTLTLTLSLTLLWGALAGNMDERMSKRDESRDVASCSLPLLERLASLDAAVSMLAYGCSWRLNDLSWGKVPHIGTVRRGPPMMTLQQYSSG